MNKQKYYKIPEYELRQLLYGYFKWLNKSCRVNRDIETQINEELEHGWISGYEIKPAKF